MAESKTIEAKLDKKNPGTQQEPDQAEIAALAYEFWIERGSPHGSHEEDWHRAEAELRKGKTMTKTASA
jgi:hypothetical protein